MYESALQSEIVHVTSIIDKTLAPACWDSPPLVQNLKAAAEGVCTIRNRQIRIMDEMVARKDMKKVHGDTRPALHLASHPSFHFQSSAYKIIKDTVLDSSFHKVVERRIRNLSLHIHFPNSEYVYCHLKEGLAECRELHKTCGSALMSSWIKNPCEWLVHLRPHA